MKCRHVEDGEFDVRESCALRLLPDVFDYHIIRDYVERLHLVLRLRRVRMLRPRLSETCYAAFDQNARHLRKHFRRVGHVMKCVQADDSINARIGQVEPLAIEEQKLRLRLFAYDGLTIVKLAPNL